MTPPAMPCPTCRATGVVVTRGTVTTRDARGRAGEVPTETECVCATCAGSGRAIDDDDPLCDYDPDDPTSVAAAYVWLVSRARRIYAGDRRMVRRADAAIRALGDLLTSPGWQAIPWERRPNVTGAIQ